MPATYSERHLDPQQALAYRDKFRRSLTRRLSHRRELRIVRAALDAAWTQAGAAPRLLDFPCGAGRFAPLLAARAGGYVAADHSPHMLALCRGALEQAGLLHKAIEFREGDARSMPFADATFDVACCLRLLHHFPEASERERILREFRRVTRGPLVVSWLDAGSPKQWIHAHRLALAGGRNRRAAVHREQLAAEGAAAGLRLLRTWSLSGLFSGQAVALFATHGST